MEIFNNRSHWPPVDEVFGGLTRTRESFADEFAYEEDEPDEPDCD